MPIRRREKTVYPEGADQRFLKQLQRRARTERERRFKAEHAAFLRRGELAQQAVAPLMQQLGLDREKLQKALGPKLKALHDLTTQPKGKRSPPPRGRNPARYAPFDMPWQSINCGGVGTCSLYGPVAATGLLGADIGSLYAGGASAVTSVGFWYYAQQDGTLFISTAANVYGAASVESGLLGYSSSYVGLRAYIERYSTDFTVFSAMTDVYNAGGILDFNITYFNGDLKTASIFVPLRANTWYAIWSDCVQNVNAGGFSEARTNIAMYVGPVVYFVV